MYEDMYVYIYTCVSIGMHVFMGSGFKPPMFWPVRSGQQEL